MVCESQFRILLTFRSRISYIVAETCRRYGVTKHITRFKTMQEKLHCETDLDCWQSNATHKSIAGSERRTYSQQVVVSLVWEARHLLSQAR